MPLNKTDEQIIQLFESGAVRTKLAAVQHYKPRLNRQEAQQFATDLWKKAEVVERNAFIAESTHQEVEAVLSAQRFQWRAMAEGIETLLLESGVCEVVQVPDRNKELFDMRCVLLPGAAIPTQALPFIKRIELVNAYVDGDRIEQRRATVAHEYGPKERLRASELLAKSYGQLIERQELTGGNGSPLTVASISADMSQIEAAEIYKRAIGRGGK